MKQFKCRASASGKLMTSPRSKTETLSETTKSYVEEWAKSGIYGIQKEIKSKYIDKGNLMEDLAIEKAVEWLNLPFFVKNDTTFEDDFFTGTPDILFDDTVLDIKVSWDCFTFPLFEKEIPTKDYYYQLQVYMYLTKKTKAKLVYVLLNTPEFMTYETVYDYSEIDPKYKVKCFDFDFDPTVIETLKLKVVECRNYYSQISI